MEEQAGRLIANLTKFIDKVTGSHMAALPGPGHNFRSKALRDTERRLAGQGSGHVRQW